MNRDMSFSTISKKSPIIKDQNSRSLTPDVINRFSGIIKQNQSLQKSINLNDKPAVDNEQMRKNLTFTDIVNTHLTLVKKGKKLGGDVVRDIKLGSEGELLKISQNKNSKEFSAPNKFIPESFEEYEAKMKQATKEEKKNILPWNSKAVKNAAYRISFIRKPTGPNSTQIQDASFYFETKEQFDKAKNYFKCLQILEANPSTSKSNLLLEKLYSNFRHQLTSKFRWLIAKKADEKFQKLTRMRAEMFKRVNFLGGLDPTIVSSVLERWKLIAAQNFEREIERERIRKERIDKLSYVVKNANTLGRLDGYLVKSIIYSWKQESDKRVQPDKQDIVIEFNSLELTSAIIHPTIKLEINIARNYPDSPFINGQSLSKRELEYTLDCKIKNRRNARVYCWKLVAQKSADSLMKDQLGLGSVNPSDEEKFTLTFNQFAVAHVDLVEIKVILFDETDTVKAYHYVSLKHIYQACNKGNDMWLCMGINDQERNKFPLLHLKAKAYSSEKNKLSSMALRNEIKLYDKDYIEDTFFSYKFKLPTITPKHVKFLELLPEEWNILDEKTKSLERSSEMGEFIQRIKYKLYKRYHANTTRQLAKLKKSAYIWASLQDDLTAHVPQKGEANIWVNEEFVRNLQGVKRVEFDDIQQNSSIAQTGNPDYSRIVSYLFKRDEWEMRKEWGSFYAQLKLLARKGIPPQHRMNIWSELGRVVYFINLTEKHHQQQRGMKFYHQVMNPDNEDPTFGSDSVSEKSKRVYEHLKKDASQEFLYLYQELEDDITFLKQEIQKEKFDFENNLRNICRTFIFWTKLFSDSSTHESIRYFVSYSRSILSICYGLVICDTCSYLESEVKVEEDQVFWLLLAISTYILSSYFETNESSLSVDNLTNKSDKRKKNSITNSALRCPLIRGVKSDLLFLKLLLQDKEIEIYNKFDELGLPLEYYFADHMTSLFVNLFSPGLTFRIWDIIFFEGSSSNQNQGNRFIVSVIFQLLRDCKPMILKAKKSSDIKFILETYSKFQTKYGQFIKEVYSVIKNLLEQKIPSDANVIDRLSFIRYALFTDQHNRFDKKIQSIQKEIEEHHKDVFEQNLAFFALANNKYNYTQDDVKTLSYSTISKMIKDLHGYIGTNKANHKYVKSDDNIKGEFDYNADNMFDYNNYKGGKVFSETGLSVDKFLREKVSEIHFKIHKLSLIWPDLESLVINVVYGKEKLRKESIHNLNIDFEGEFVLKNIKDIPRYLLIEINDEKDRTIPRKIKSMTIDLKRIQVNSLTKLIYKFREENPDIPNENFTTSEAEISILMISPQKSTVPDSLSIRAPQTLYVSEFENTSYKIFRGLNLDQIFKPENQTLGNMADDPLNIDSYKYTFLSKTRHAWKENFAMNYEEFLQLIKKIAPFWVGMTDFFKIFNLISKVNQNQRFYINDFYTLLILFGKFTFNQKLSLIFDLLTGFDQTFADKTSEIPYYVIKGLVCYLYDVFMIYMPYNELENVLDLTIHGYTSTIKKVVINGQTEKKIEYPRQMLNRLANFIHLTYQMKEIHLYHQEILNLLKDIYETELTTGKLLNRNSVEITYFTNGMSHKIKLEMDQNWKLIENLSEILVSAKTTSLLLNRFQYTIALQNPPTILSKDQFIHTMQKIPLINYLSSFENTEFGSSLTSLNQNIRYRVVIQSENVFNYTVVNNSLFSNVDDPSKKKDKPKFKKVLRDWEDIVLRFGMKHPSYNNLNFSQSKLKYKYQPEEKKLGVEKIDIYYSYSKIMRNIKKNMIKTIIQEVSQNLTTAERFNPAVFTEAFWMSDFKCSILINNKEYELKNTTNLSPFMTLMDISRDFPNEQRDIKTAEVVFFVRPNIIPENYEDPFNQLSLYRYADGSSEWLPCKLEYKFQYENQTNLQPIPQSDGKEKRHMDGFGVIFERFSNEIIMKRNAEVAIVHRTDIDELEFKIKPKIIKDLPKMTQSQEFLTASPTKQTIGLENLRNPSASKSPQKTPEKKYTNDQYTKMERKLLSENEEEFSGKLKIKHAY